MRKRFLIFTLIFIVIASIIFYLSKNTYSIDTPSSKYITINKPVDNNSYFNNLKSFNNYTVADPYLLKKDDTYYAYSTGCAGISILTSKNFNDWELLTKRAINDDTKYTCFWAPEVYYYNSKYYMFYVGTIRDNTTEVREIVVASSADPSGPFKNEAVINSKVSLPIDPTVLFDDDGKIYLYTKSEYGSNGKFNGDGTSIFVEELNSDLLSVKDINPKKVLFLPQNNNDKDKYNYWERTLIEGQFVIKRNNKYYMMYTTGAYVNDTYTVGYAISDSPTSGFEKQTLGNGYNSTSSLLHGAFSVNDNYDSDNNLYGTGHNSIYKVSDDEMYIVYHSAVFKNNKYVDRKLNVDYIGFDSQGRLYVNGPTSINQPAPSGTNNLYKLDTSEYKVYSGVTKMPFLNDNINYNANNSATALKKTPLTTCNKITTNTITIKLDYYRNIEDIWLFGTEEGFNDKKATVIINDKYYINDYSLGNTGNAKIQLPEINEYVKTINITFSGNITISEVNLYNTNEEFIFKDELANFDDNIINLTASEETLEKVREKFDTKHQVEIISSNNKENIIKTGDRILIKSDNKTKSYLVSVVGDVTGDGRAEITDITKLYRYLKGKSNLSDIEKKAGDVTGDGEVNITDITKMYRYLKGKIPVLTQK